MGKMGESHSESQGPTGILFTGKGIKSFIEVESVESLIAFSKKLKGGQLRDFQRDYGDILDLLHIPIQVEMLRVFIQYWDNELRCFSFPTFQITHAL